MRIKYVRVERSRYWIVRQVTFEKGKLHECKENEYLVREARLSVGYMLIGLEEMKEGATQTDEAKTVLDHDNPKD